MDRLEEATALEKSWITLSDEAAAAPSFHNTAVLFGVVPEKNMFENHKNQRVWKR